MPKKNVIIFGYDELLLTTLDLFSETDTEISAVVFPSNRADPRIDKIRSIVKGRGFRTIRQPPRKRISKFVKKLRSIKPDLIFVWSYTMILPADVVEIPKLGSVNLHMGLLPEYRGVNGIRWALINGEEETGVTLHYMDAGIDTGDIISKAKFPIDPEDDILSLMLKSRAAGLDLLKNTWHQIISGTAKASPQDESKAGYYSAKMSDIETIDWSRPSNEISCLIRASAIPFPGVSTFWNDQKLTIRKAFVQETDPAGEPHGTITNISKEGIEVATGNGKLFVTEIELDGDKTRISRLIEMGLKTGDVFSNG
ncbi:MAG: methionyl-tRNA formyltransferase [Pyrinomonadaceae bacterium]|nr:methionyl-tRNA formyltransferase [Pyrinomonadaceae bacterium]